MRIDTDYQRWLELVHAIMTDSSQSDPLRLICPAIGEQFQAPVTAAVELGPHESWAGLYDGEPFDLSWYVQHTADHPAVQFYLRTHSAQVAVLSDVAQSADTAPARAVLQRLRKDGLEENLWFPLPANGPAYRWLATGRRDALSSSEVVLAMAIHPLIVALDSHVAVLRGWRARWAHEDLPGVSTVSDATSRVHDAGLTTRELVVLQLLADGLVAKQIARSMGISVRTVTTHLDRVYRKLGAHDRLSAVSTGRRLGVLTAPTVARPSFDRSQASCGFSSRPRIPAQRVMPIGA